MKYLSILDHHGKRIPISAVTDYEGAGSGRRLNTWGTSTSGPSTVVSYNLATLRSRSRELIRNNPLADGGVDAYVATIIGSGIAPRWQLEDREATKALQDLWDWWTEEADVYGRLSYYGLQSLVCRGLIDAGEMLIRFVRHSKYNRLSVPLQLQLLEADHLDESFTTVQDGKQVRMGIEIDAFGVPTGYWIWPEHPGEPLPMLVPSIARVRIGTDDMIHVFKPLRAGQMRGRPWLSSVIVKLHELDQYDDAELVRKKGAAMFGGFLEEDSGESDHGDPGLYIGRKLENDENDQEIIALEPGTFPRLPKGLKVNFSSPVDVGTTYEAWMKKQLRDIAKGIGVTYEQLTGDLSGVNFSSIRAGINDLKKRVVQLQTEIIGFQMNRRVIYEFLDTAFLSNRLSFTDYFANPRKYRAFTQNPDAWPSVNPLQDAQADQLEVRAGFASRAAKVAARGNDVETVDRESKADHEREDKDGLVYQSNAGKLTSTGNPVAKEGKEGAENEENNAQ